MRRSRVLWLMLVVCFMAASLKVQAQSMMTHHVRDVVRNGEAQQVEDGCVRPDDEPEYRVCQLGDAGGAGDVFELRCMTRASSIVPHSF